MKYAVITGATCSLGVALVKFLRQKGVEVTAIIRPCSGRLGNLPADPGIQTVAGELSDLSGLSSVLPWRPGGGFFHLAWNSISREMTGDPLAQAKSIVYTLDAVNLAHALGCDVFVGAGSQAEYGRKNQPLTPDLLPMPETSYGIAKLAAGQLSRRRCDDLGMKHGWARILSLYGPYDKDTTGIMYCIRALLSGERPSLTPAEQIWDYIYVADCARALWLIAEKGQHGVPYPVGSGMGLPLRQYFEWLRDAIDPTFPLKFGDKPYSPQQVMYLQADLQQLSADTGFYPEYSFSQGIEAMIEWVKNREGGYL